VIEKDVKRGGIERGKTGWGTALPGDYKVGGTGRGKDQI